jgi:hypothetical protein
MCFSQDRGARRVGWVDLRINSNILSLLTNLWVVKRQKETLLVMLGFALLYPTYRPLLAKFTDLSIARFDRWWRPVLD